MASLPSGRKPFLYGTDPFLLSDSLEEGPLSVSSLAQSCPTLCNYMDCGTPGFSVLHYPLCFAQIHVHWGSDAIQPSHFLLPPFSSCLKSFPVSGSFPMSWLFTSGGQSIGASASASVIPVYIQSSFPLELTGLISCCQRILRSLQFESTSFSEFSLLCGPALASVLDYRIIIGLTTWTFVGKVISLLFNMLLRFVIAFLPRNECLNFMATVTTWQRHCSENESCSQKVSSSCCGPLLWDSGPLSPNSFSNSPVTSNKSLPAFVVLAVCSSPSL